MHLVRTPPRRLALSLTATTAHASPTATSGDGKPLAVTSPRDRNDLAHDRCDIDERTITGNADAPVSAMEYRHGPIKGRGTNPDQPRNLTRSVVPTRP
ncbi:hypothetical protein ACFV0O_28310 [Kitasatospora sp. NPDC059577]|uniref:hypothetical protein n=1 Tax=Kitasatospora sp. NPDC059577 TaxID=3346873 RepID=UPI00368540D3